jgi:hypothetical protein
MHASAPLLSKGRNFSALSRFGGFAWQAHEYVLRSKGLPYPHVFLYIKPAVQATYGKSRKVKNRFFDSFKTERNTLS